MPRPPINKIVASDFWRLEHSVSVISISVVESDIGYPIYVYGTILARDQYDYRCIYLFKCGVDNPQLIMSSVSILFPPYTILIQIKINPSTLVLSFTIDWQ